MLKMSGLCKTFRTDEVETLALDHIDLEIDEGEFVALLGASGSGKSTLLNIAGLLESFDEGEYHLDGTDVTELNDRHSSRVRNEKVGFIFQSFNLIPDLSVFDNIEVPLRYRGINLKLRRQRIEELLELVGLGGRTKHLPSQLSGGQQQRVAIARALATQPKLLLADEPTGNLDSSMADEVLDLIQQLHQSGATILMVTHDESLASRAQRCTRLRDGRIDFTLENG